MNPSPASNLNPEATSSIQALRELYDMEIRPALEKDLVRENELGKNNSFESAAYDIRYCQQQLEIYFKLNLEQLPTFLLSGMLEAARRFNEVLAEILKFNVGQQNFSSVRKKVISNTSSSAKQIGQLVYQALMHATYVEDKVLELKGNIEATHATQGQKLSELAQKLDEAETLINKLDEKFLESGVDQYTINFRNESKDHRNASIAWLIASAGMITAIILVARNFLDQSGETADSTAAVIQFTITKVVILSAMFYGLSICNRNYKAHRHNQVLNKHRQNALTTFQAFVNAASDESTKNAVLMEATRTIFSPQQTGHLSSEKDTESPNKIVEIIKGVASAK